MSIIKPCCDCPESFLELNDTPDSYLGQGGKFVAVKSTENGLEFVTLNITANQILFFDTVADLNLQDTINLNDNQIAYVKETNTFYYLRKNGVNKATPYDPLKINVYSSVDGIWVNTKQKVLYFSNNNYTTQDGLCPETAFNINTYNNINIQSVIDNLNIYYIMDIPDNIKRTLTVSVSQIYTLNVIGSNYPLDLVVTGNLIKDFYITYNATNTTDIFTVNLRAYIHNLYLDGSDFSFNVLAKSGLYKIKNVFLFSSVNKVDTFSPFDFVSTVGIGNNNIIAPTTSLRTNDIYNYSSLLTYDTTSQFFLLDNVEVINSYIDNNNVAKTAFLKYKIHYNTIPKYFNILNQLPFNKSFANGQYFELITKEIIKNVPECCYEYDTTKKKYVLRGGQIQYFTIDKSIIQNSYVGAILLNIVVENTLSISTDTGLINDTITDTEKWYILSKKEFSAVSDNIDSYFTIQNSSSSNAYFLMKVIYLYVD